MAYTKFNIMQANKVLQANQASEMPKLWDELYVNQITITDETMCMAGDIDKLVQDAHVKLLSDAWMWFATNNCVPVYKLKINKIKNASLCADIYRLHVPVRHLLDQPE